MPIYAFECDACGHSFDRLQRLSDADPTDCPQCGAAQVRRQLTAPQFRLSGSGWYETDFKKDGDKKRNLTDAAGAGAGGGEAKGGDAKPADKPAEKSSTADSKAAGSKPAGSKPVEAKPSAPATKTGGAD